MIYQLDSSNILFGPGEGSTSKNNVILSSSAKFSQQYDLLIFVDSRGLEREPGLGLKNTWAYKIIRSSNKNQSVLLVSRPKNITTFATLINFLQLNNISYNKLITNLGFVDFTPKKKSIIDDMERQLGSLESKGFKLEKLEKYKLANNSLESLYSIIYHKKLLDYISNTLHQHCIYKNFFINTVLVDKSVSFSRKRPESFFSKIFSTNQAITKITKLHTNNVLIDISTKDIQTFDAVHYNKIGHKNIFNIINEALIKDND